MASAVVHFDISGPDPEELHKFYGELFAWKISPVPDMNYAFVDTEGGSGISGGIGKAPDGPGQVAFYVASDDLQATLDRAEALGGTTTQPLVVIPETVSLAGKNRVYARDKFRTSLPHASFTSEVTTT